MALKLYRGDVVVCVAQGDYGKPGPVVIVQSDLLNLTHASLVICPITSHLIDAPAFRLSVDPSKKNGVERASQIMVDKVMTIKREKIKKKVGKLSPADIASLDAALKLCLSL